MIRRPKGAISNGNLPEAQSRGLKQSEAVSVAVDHVHMIEVMGDRDQLTTNQKEHSNGTTSKKFMTHYHPKAFCPKAFGQEQS